jgi:hypothetical protein
MYVYIYIYIYTFICVYVYIEHTRITAHIHTLSLTVASRQTAALPRQIQPLETFWHLYVCMSFLYARVYCGIRNRRCVVI